MLLACLLVCLFASLLFACYYHMLPPASSLLVCLLASLAIYARLVPYLFLVLLLPSPSLVALLSWTFCLAEALLPSQTSNSSLHTPQLAPLEIPQVQPWSVAYKKGSTQLFISSLHSFRFVFASTNTLSLQWRVPLEGRRLFETFVMIWI